jgi:hypothetical protein
MQNAAPTRRISRPCFSNRPQAHGSPRRSRGAPARGAIKDPSKGHAPCRCPTPSDDYGISHSMNPDRAAPDWPAAAIAGAFQTLSHRKVVVAEAPQSLLAAWRLAAKINSNVIVQEIIEGPDTAKRVYVSCYDGRGRRIANAMFRETRCTPVNRWWMLRQTRRATGGSLVSAIQAFVRSR